MGEGLAGLATGVLTSVALVEAAQNLAVATKQARDDALHSLSVSCEGSDNQGVTDAIAELMGIEDAVDNVIAAHVNAAEGLRAYLAEQGL